MDAGVVTIIAALIAALPPTLTAILSSKKNRDSIKDVAQKVDRTEEELKQHREMLIQQGELIAKQERAFRERKKHEELQSKLEITNLEATQVILESLHKTGVVNGDCEIHRNKLNALKSEMAAQALHLEDDDIKY